MVRSLSIRDHILPQPPSFIKKKNYELHEILGEGTFGKVIRATWTPPPVTPLHPNTTGGEKKEKKGLLSRSSSRTEVSGTSTAKTMNADGSGSGKEGRVVDGESHGVGKKEVALKVIPKKKVKGHEEVVWGEMEVLKGLDHPNIVCLFLFTLPSLLFSLV